MNKSSSLFLILFFTGLSTLIAQDILEIAPQQAEGLPISDIKVFVTKGDSIRLVKNQEQVKFLEYFDLINNSIFRTSVFDQIQLAISQREGVIGVDYQTFLTQVSGEVSVRWNVDINESDVKQPIDKLQKGIAVDGEKGAFPLLLQNDRSKLTLILNGGFGTYLENEAFFGQGDAFTQGNPIATNPANGGNTFWTEYFLEPGVGGILRLGDSNMYAYGAISTLISARVGRDIFADESKVFTDIERAYAGILFTRLGKNEDMKLDISLGRNFFQLNDGFLFSRYSGSSNAGDRASLFLNSRTAYDKTAFVNFKYKNLTVSSFFLEPQELFDDRQSNTNYTGLSLEYNNQKSINTGVTVINRTNGSGNYAEPNNQNIERQGLWVFNPKLWLTNIANTGLFFRSEYVLETKDNMFAQAGYLTLGMKPNNVSWKPSIFYRYAHMDGDDPNTSQYERFDPLLTGGLGNWIQGINFRKVVGTGNIVSHRIELRGYFFKKLSLSLDAFFLRADELNNLGGLAPISQLTNKELGQEYSLTAQYSINKNFLLLGVWSSAIPGKGITRALNSAQTWHTAQLSLFMFF